MNLQQKQVLYKDGDKYFGQLTSDGKLSGIGTYTFKNGSYYKGSFKNNEFFGKGQLYDKTNNLTIQGTFSQGKANCSDGKIKYVDDSRYTGSIKDNMRDGQGKYIFSKQSQYQYYEGSFKRDRFDGTGTLQFKNRSQYRGYFTDGVYHGRGQYKTPQFGYKGDFKNGRIQGDGIIVYTGGETYKGSFKHNYRHGQGVYTYSSGEVYSGTWKQDKRHGKGKLIFPTGEYYQGQFQQDQMSGMGKFVTSDQVTQGEFQQSKLNGEVTSIFPATNTIVKGIYKNGLKNGFFKVQRQVKGQKVWFRGQFINDKQHPYNKTMSSRI